MCAQRPLSTDVSSWQRSQHIWEHFENRWSELSWWPQTFQPEPVNTWAGPLVCTCPQVRWGQVTFDQRDNNWKAWESPALIVPFIPSVVPALPPPALWPSRKPSCEESERQISYSCGEKRFAHFTKFPCEAIGFLCLTLRRLRPIFSAGWKSIPSVDCLSAGALILRGSGGSSHTSPVCVTCQPQKHKPRRRTGFSHLLNPHHCGAFITRFSWSRLLPGGTGAESREEDGGRAWQKRSDGGAASEGRRQLPTELLSQFIHYRTLCICNVLQPGNYRLCAPNGFENNEKKI